MEIKCILTNRGTTFCITCGLLINDIYINKAGKFKIFKICSSTGPMCKPLTVVNSNTTNHTGTQDDTVLVLCDTGFEVASGVDSLVVNCAQNRIWKPSVSCSSNLYL